jgi:hypothetical protein
MHSKRQRFLLIVSVILNATTTYAEDVILRLAPSETAPIIDRIDRTSHAAQAADSESRSFQTDDDWKRINHTAILNGYIPTRSLSKNFEIEPNTAVLAKPQASAHALASIQPKDQFKVIASNDKWTAIQFRKTIPLYFRDHTLTNSTAPNTQDSPRPQQLKIDPHAKTANISPSALEPENVTWRAAPAGTTTPTLPMRSQPLVRPQTKGIMTCVHDLQDSELPKSPKIQNDAPLRSLVGTLIREINESGPRYPLRLKLTFGKRLVYVDISHVFISDLRPFINQSVQIIGEVQRLVPGSEDLVIQARTIRIAE